MNFEYRLTVQMEPCRCSRHLSRLKRTTEAAPELRRGSEAFASNASEFGALRRSREVSVRRLPGSGRRRRKSSPSVMLTISGPPLQLGCVPASE